MARTSARGIAPDVGTDATVLEVLSLGASQREVDAPVDGIEGTETPVQIDLAWGEKS